MISALFSMKRNEIRFFLQSLMIFSKTTYSLLKLLVALCLLSIGFIYSLYAPIFIELLHMYDVTVLAHSFNPFVLILLLALLGNNRAILRSTGGDSIRFYYSLEILLFFYVKEKWLMLLCLTCYLFIELHGAWLGLYDCLSLVTMLASVLLTLLLHIFYLHIMSTRDIYLLKTIKLPIVLICFTGFVILRTYNISLLANIPWSFLYQFPSLYLLANLIVYSEMISSDGSYKQLFTMNKYLHTSFWSFVHKTILFKKTYVSYSGMSAVIIFLLLHLHESFSKIALLFGLMFVNYVVLLYLITKITTYEAFFERKNYFLYFVMMEYFLFTSSIIYIVVK